MCTCTSTHITAKQKALRSIYTSATLLIFIGLVAYEASRRW